MSASRVRSSVYKLQVTSSRAKTSHSQLIGLGLYQRHGVLVICAVRRMRINHHIRAPGTEETVKGLRIQAVAFDEITVQIKMQAVTAKAEHFKPS
jgi:hypothetical protein